MARLARFVFPGHPHHVAQEGSADRRIFETGSDYRLYLGWLGEYANRYRVEIWAYCLRPDRVDLVCVPRTANSLALAFNSLHMRYAQFINSRNGRQGPLWRSRFMSCVMDGPTAREDVRSVEMIPVNAALADRAEDYPWSSAKSRVKGDSDPVVSLKCPLTDALREWRAFLAGSPDEDLLEKVRERLRTGRPAGEADFVSNLEAVAGRRLMAMPRGRPKKIRRDP